MALSAFNSSLETTELRAMIGDIPQSITLADGTVVSASVTTGGEADELEFGGVTDKRTLTAVIMVADCMALPKANDVITFNGRNYRLTDPTTHDDGLAITVPAVGEWE